LKLPTSNGIPYLPDGVNLDDPPRRPLPMWVRVAMFVACYASLQAFYAQCGGNAIERFFLEDMGSQPAAVIIDVLYPSLGVEAPGPRLIAPGGGGVNIGNGCEGTDLYFLLFAAFAVVSLSWRRRAIGLGLGLLLAFMLNQARIISLFFAFRSDPALFNLLHTTVAPIFLILALALFFHAWLRYSPVPANAAA
jgi:exosortase/archaeosortase family protein